MEEKPLSVLLAAAEAWPFIKTGGLADVLGGLPAALSKAGARVSVAMPFYTRATSSGMPVYKISSPEVLLGGARKRVTVYKSFVGDAYEAFLIRHDPSFARPWPYGPPGGDYPDNAERFALFSRAVAGLIGRLDEPVDVVHCHDWQAALIPLLLEGTVPTVFTIHNIGYQGIFPAAVLPAIGIPPDYYHPEGIEFYGKVNFMKAGVIWGDAVTTVSPAYSREIQDYRHGFGLDGLLRKYSWKLEGILNGADYSRWDPLIDTHIAARYGAGDTGGKMVCKLDLLRRLGLPADGSVPLIGMTTRLVHQKGTDLVLDALPRLAGLGAHLAVLGSGDPAYEAGMREAAGRHPFLRAVIGFDEETAHRIVAGSDLFLMPSRYEPCGLSQIYALRYGTIPVVRATGGLIDTVDQFDPGTGRGTGFLFGDATAEALARAVEEALAAWRDRDCRRQLMANAMARDFSWTGPAARYLELYRKVAAANSARRREAGR